MNPEKLEQEIDSYMSACYGNDWGTRLNGHQINEVQQAFLSGMIVAFGIDDPLDALQTIITIKQILLQKGMLPNGQ